LILYGNEQIVSFAQPREQKFFVSFFQERNASFLTYSEVRTIFSRDARLHPGSGVRTQPA
jgi:hypothetical protein